VTDLARAAWQEIAAAEEKEKTADHPH